MEVGIIIIIINIIMEMMRKYNNIKLFATDVDGVLTDAGMYYDNKKNELKKFNTKDSIGFNFLKTLNIPTIIITSENTNIVKRRAEKLKIKDCFLGIKNKLELCLKVCKKYKISIDEVAFIGDEINDLELIKKVGLSACPSDAAGYIKKNASWVLNKKGGEGVFREFVIKYLKATNQYNQALNKSINFYKQVD